MRPLVDGGITGHSLAYLARRREIEERKRKHGVVKEEEGKREKVRVVEVREKVKKEAAEVLVKALGVWAGQMK